MASVDFHFDPMCPFAYQTSLWLRNVREQLGFTVRWRFFSLEWVNHVEGKKFPWERDWSYGWSLMRIGAALRRRDMDLLDRWYALIGAELHERGGSPHRPEQAARLLDELGVGAAVLDDALTDPGTHDEVTRDHQRVLAAGGFGVPTLFLDGEQCLFGPVLVDPPAGEQALALWRVVTGMAAFPHVYELQRPKSAADLALIADRLRPYVCGRDWVSVDRGRVIDLDGVVGGEGAR
ncbi:MAG TPA: DsbA family protein [Nocardia sp.]|uniref:mycothiol-dependent nitroreductase Rv2466c family protein n=1 Tax=Nocardia TaxID=1817 RepID=UPI002458A034|nr:MULTISPECIES: DsbA family protein [Nocardia]HLS75831.1 DsbA family protein [Nocardia sp.]